MKEQNTEFNGRHRFSDEDARNLEERDQGEMMKLAEEIRPLKDIIFTKVMTLSNQSEGNRYRRLYQEAVDLTRDHNEINELVKTGKTTDILVSNFTSLCIAASTKKRFEDTKKIELKYASQKDVDKLHNGRMVTVLPSTVVKTRGLSIENVIDDQEKRKIPSVKLFSWILENSLEAAHRNHPPIDTDQPYELNEHPATREGGAYTSSIQVLALGLLNDRVNHFMPTNSRNELARNAVSLLKYVNLAKRDVLNILQNPDSENFVELAINLSDLVEKNSDNASFLFFLLRSKDELDYTSLYRALSEKVSHPEYGGFYSQISSLLKKELLKKSLPTTPSVDDQEMFLNGSNQAEIIVPDLSDLTKSISGRQGLLRGQQEIHPGSIEFGSVVKPDKVLFEFDEKKSTSFTIRFVYESQESEETFVDLYGDTRANTYDWNFLEKGDQASFLWNRFWEVGRKVYENVCIEIKSIAEEKAKNRNYNPKVTSQKREYSGRDPIYDLRKESRNAEVSKSFQEDIIESFADKKIKNSAVLHQDRKDFRDLFRVSDEDYNALFEELKTKNEEGTLVLSKLRKKGIDGSDRFTYRTRLNGTVARVLFRLGNQEAIGSRQFEVVRGGYRKDVYRDENLE